MRVQAGAVCLLTLLGVACWGVEVVAEETTSTFVSLNGTVCRVNRPEGELLFRRSKEDPEHVLDGMSPWVGEIDGRRAIVRTYEDFKGPAEGYIFIDGWLRRALKGDREIDVPKPTAPVVASPKDLWTHKKERGSLARPPDIWRDSGRLRLWFFNPNVAGAFLSVVALFCFLTAIDKLKKCRLFCGLFAILGVLALYGEFLTGSRGGFVSFLAGLFAWFVCRWRHFLSAKVLGGVALAVVCVTGALVGSGSYKRFTSGLVRTKGDESNALRVEMLQAAPQMFAAAPNGWGWGESGRAYIDWFQSRQDSLNPNLVSGHLSTLVDLGWWNGGVYVFMWLALVLGLFAVGLRGGNPVGCVTVTALGVSGLLNPTTLEWESYLVPALSVLCTLRDVRKLRRADGVWAVVVAAVFAVVGVGGMVAWGRTAELPCVRSGNVVCFNGDAPKTIVVDDDFAMNGGYWWFQGKEMRAWFKVHPESCVGYVRRLLDVPQGVERLVLIGRAGEDYLANRQVMPKVKSLVFLSPSFDLSRVPAELIASVDVAAWRGEHVATRGERALDWVTIVRGAELYLPKWLDYVVSDD